MDIKISVYCKRNKQGNIESIPFLEYISEQYDTDKEEDLRRITNIKAHIIHIAGNNARYNQPPYAEQYRERNIGVLKVKEGEKLLRIAFYAKIGKQMVLLSAKHKPKLYEKGKKKQVDKEIMKWLDEAESYLHDIKQHPNSIIPFNL